MHSNFMVGFADEFYKLSESKESEGLASRAQKALKKAGRRAADYKSGHDAGRKAGAKGREYKLTAGDTASQIGHGAKDLAVGSAKAVGGLGYMAGKGVYHGAKGAGTGLRAASEAVGSGVKKVTDSEVGRTGLGALALGLLARKMLKKAAPNEVRAPGQSSVDMPKAKPNPYLGKVTGKLNVPSGAPTATNQTTSTPPTVAKAPKAPKAVERRTTKWQRHLRAAKKSGTYADAKAGKAAFLAKTENKGAQRYSKPVTARAMAKAKRGAAIKKDPGLMAYGPAAIGGAIPKLKNKAKADAAYARIKAGMLAESNAPAVKPSANKPAASGKPLVASYKGLPQNSPLRSKPTPARRPVATGGSESRRPVATGSESPQEAKPRRVAKSSNKFKGTGPVSPWGRLTKHFR
jgi:hypothetical protein